MAKKTESKTLVKIAVMPFAKFYMWLSAVFGFIMGVVMTLATIVSAIVGAPGNLGGYLSFVWMTVLYGIIGFLAGALTAWAWDRCIAISLGSVLTDARQPATPWCCLAQKS